MLASQNACVLIVVRVSFVLASDEFEWDTIYVSRLVSRAEAESLGYEVGASVWHEEPDFGFSGWADIAAVEPVHIEAGAGCAVVATVVHQNGDILRLAFSDGTEVTGTGRHRFWSETRRAWVAARELREGETLRTPSGVVRLESATPSRTLTAVYNLEVEGAHEYFVGEGEVLVHNGKCGRTRASSPQSGRYSGQRRPRRRLPTTSRSLLPGELEMGEFGGLTNDVGDDITGHHMPSAEYMEQRFGISRDDSLALNLEQPTPGVGGRHRRTESYGRRPFLDEAPRDALARDIADVRRILQEDGVYGAEARGRLQAYIAMSKQRFPQLFER